MDNTYLHELVVFERSSQLSPKYFNLSAFTHEGLHSSIIFSLNVLIPLEYVTWQP
jgi:hypothetical protein